MRNEKTYKAKSVQKKEREMEELIKKAMGLAQRGQAARAKEMLQAEIAKKGTSSIYKRQMYAVLGFVHLGENDLGNAEEYFLKSLNNRYSCHLKCMERGIMLASYAGLTVCYGQKFCFEQEKKSRNLLKIKAQTYAQLIIQNYMFEKGEKKSLEDISFAFFVLHKVGGIRKAREALEMAIKSGADGDMEFMRRPKAEIGKINLFPLMDFLYNRNNTMIKDL